MMKLTETLSPQTIRYPLAGSDKEAALGELVEGLALAHRLADPATTLETVLAHETFCSGGIGNRIALSHARSPQCPGTTLAVGRCDRSIAYRSIDGEPVDLIFLVVSPTDCSVRHTRFVNQLHRLLRVSDFRAALLAAPDAECLYDMMCLVELTANPGFSRMVA